MRNRFVALLGLLVMATVCAFGCKPQNKMPAVPTSQASSTVGSTAVMPVRQPKWMSKIVGPKRGGNFGFTVPAAGRFTIEVRGDCKKQVFLGSEIALKAMEKMNAVPGYAAAYDRHDFETINRLKIEHLGKSSEEMKYLNSDADTIYMVDLPDGSFSKSFNFVKDDYQMFVYNLSDEACRIDVAFIEP